MRYGFGRRITGIAGPGPRRLTDIGTATCRRQNQEDLNRTKSHGGSTSTRRAVASDLDLSRRNWEGRDGCARMQWSNWIFCAPSAVVYGAVLLRCSCAVVIDGDAGRGYGVTVA
jgi:hypothetical protein